LVEDDATGRRHYVGLGFHDLRRASATSLVAAGVDVKTAQTVLGHSDVRLRLDHYAQAVTEQQRAAADVMGARFIDGSPRGNAGRSRRRAIDRTPPKTTERACEQALSWVSGGGDLNSLPLGPERASR
jgi:Phage integrase family